MSSRSAGACEPAIAGYSAEGGAVGGGCSGYIVKQPVIECKPLHPVSTAPPFAECRLAAAAHTMVC